MTPTFVGWWGRRTPVELLLGAILGIATLVVPAHDASLSARDAPSSQLQSGPKILEVGPVSVTNLVFSEATGDSNSFHLKADDPLSVTPMLVRVTENSTVVLPGVEAQAGAAWFPPTGGNAAPAGTGRNTTVHWEVHVGDDVSGTGTFTRTGVPSPSEWADWYGDEGPYPHGNDALTNDQLRMTFDLECEAEPFTEGSNTVKFKLWGKTYVWRNGWTPQNWRQTPTEPKEYNAILTPEEQIVAETPYAVWKEPASDEITRVHPADSTVVKLWSRNRARIQYRGNLQTYETPTIVTPGANGEIVPEHPLNQSQVVVRTRLHDHVGGTHPPVKVRVTPDYDPIRVDVVYKYWSLKKNRGREYRRTVTLPPTLLYCVQTGAPEDLPPGTADPPLGGAPAQGQKARRSASSPGARIQPQGAPAEPVNGSTRVRIVSLLAGEPTLELDASPDADDTWMCHECLEPGDQVEFQYEYRDIFGRIYEDTIAVNVPDSLDLASPDTLALGQPTLVLTQSLQDPEPVLNVETVVLDLGSAAFGVFRRLPGLSISDMGGAGSGTTDADGRFMFDVPHGTILQLDISDSDGTYLPLSMPPTPPLETHLTHREIEPGAWRDDRMMLWMTPSFASGRLHLGSGRLDDHDGELFSRIGAVSDIAPSTILGALWETLDDQPLGPAAVLPWGETARAEWGYVPALFALAPPDGVANDDPAHQATLQAVQAAGGARLRVSTDDGLEHVLDIPLEEAVASVELPSARQALQLRVAPNPFNPATTLFFELVQPSHVHLDILQVDGRHVTTLIDGPRNAGPQRVVWRGRDHRGAEVAFGVYIARLRVSGVERTQKLVLVR